MNYVIEEKYKVKSNHGSKGCQVKYNRNGYWYKLDGGCNESTNEHVASVILKNSNINNFVKYSLCTVNNKKACRSKNFLQDNELFITLDYIICNIYGIDKSENYLWTFNSVEDKFRELVKAVKIYTHNKFDFTLPLQKMLYFDLLILNRDRHLNNLGIIANTSKQTFREAPIFDNGLSLLGGCQGDVYTIGLEETIRKQNARTISGSFINQALASTGGALHSPVKINFNSLYKDLKSENTSKYVMDILNYQYIQVGKIYS